MHIHLGLKHKNVRKEHRALARNNKTVAMSERSRYFVALDHITFVAGIVGPFTVIPQVYEIFSTHQAGSVSATSWILMTIVTFPWIFYGIAHKDKAIIVSFILWEVVNVMVVVGALMYG